MQVIKAFSNHSVKIHLCVAKKLWPAPAIPIISFNIRKKHTKKDIKKILSEITNNWHN